MSTGHIAAGLLSAEHLSTGQISDHRLSHILVANLCFGVDRWGCSA